VLVSGEVSQGRALGRPDGTIVVDVDDLSSFRALVDRELNQLLRPSAAKVEQEHSFGPGFGQGTISNDVVQVQARYQYALLAAINNMRAYERVATAVVTAIEQVMQNYNESDLTAHDLITAINTQLGVR
jgi:hypothetical protein